MTQDNRDNLQGNGKRRGWLWGIALVAVLFVGVALVAPQFFSFFGQCCYTTRIVDGREVKTCGWRWFGDCVNGQTCRQTYVKCHGNCECAE